MISAVLAALAISASPAANVEPIRIALPGLSVAGLDPALAEPFTDQLAVQLTRRGVQVSTSRDIGAILGLERQRQLLGCGEQGSCIAEIAGALGVDGVVLGGVTRTGAVIQVQVRVVSAKSAGSIADWTGTVPSEEAIFPALATAARSLAAEVSKALGRPLTIDPEVIAQEQAAARRAAMRAWTLPAGVAGALFAGAGAATVVFAHGDYDRLTDPAQPHTLAEARTLRDRGATLQTLGWTGVTVGVSALGAAAVLAILGREPTGDALQATLQAGPRGTGFVLSGRFP